MGIGLLGRKVGMTRLYTEEGVAEPITAIEAGPCTVVQIKTKAKEGYSAVQLGFLPKRDSLLKKPEYYHFEKYGTGAMRHLKEFRFDADPEYKSGDVVTVEIFEPGSHVQVSGITKGRGFQGVVKRHGFKGGRASHGGEADLRRPGSIGNSAYPSRVIKGKRMPGHMGASKQTTKNLKVVGIDAEKNLIFVKGAVPGHRGGLVQIMPK